MSNEFEQQLEKLLKGEVSLDVATDQVEDTYSFEVEQPTTIGETSGPVTASVVESASVNAQQELLRELRAEARARMEGENRARAALEQEQIDLKAQREHFQNEIERLQREVKLEASNARLSLEEISMQYLPAAPMKQLPAKALSPEQQLETLRSLAEEARLARRDLEDALDEYSRWWTSRFLRFLVFVGALVVAAYLIVVASGGILRVISTVYTSARVRISTIDPEWLSTTAWVLFVVGSIALVGGGIYYLLRFVWQRFLDTQDKREETKSLIQHHRTSLVQMVFQTESSNISRHFLGRMWLMVLFTVRRKLNRL